MLNVWTAFHYQGFCHGEFLPYNTNWYLQGKVAGSPIILKQLYSDILKASHVSSPTLNKLARMVW